MKMGIQNYMAVAETYKFITFISSMQTCENWHNMLCKALKTLSLLQLILTLQIDYMNYPKTLLLMHFCSLVIKMG